MAAKHPLVSVLLPFYDDGSPEIRSKFSEALSSILSQTFRDFEVVLVVSGQRGFAEKQSLRSRKIRLSFFGQAKRNYGKIPLGEKLRGIVTAWNICIRESRGKLLAFHAYDDISLPNRLETQVRFLESNPGIGAVGSSMVMIDSEGRNKGVRKVFERDAQIRRHMTQFNPVPSPSIMTYASIVKKAGAFRADEMPEDFDLWVRMAALTKFHNLQAPLVKYRVHSGGGSSIYKFPLWWGSLRVKLRAARLLGIHADCRDVAVNLLQFVSLFFPESLRRIVLERIRSRMVVGGS
ncbi:MAG: glycosyltransferase [Candidatus Micrarchaeia archaeon]